MASITSSPGSSALPVARDWFRIRPAGDALTVIDEPHVDELLQANIWLIRGHDRDLLFDSGLGIASLRTALGGIISPDPVLVLSHAHLDHMGSAHEFADCRAHPAELVADPPPGSLEGPALAAELGLREELPPLLITARPDEAYDPAAYRLLPARVSQPLGDGDIIDRRPAAHRAAPAGTQPRQHRAVRPAGRNPVQRRCRLRRRATRYPHRIGSQPVQREPAPGCASCPFASSALATGQASGRGRLHLIIDRYLKERP